MADEKHVPYSPKSLAALMVLLFRVERDHDGNLYESFDDQISSFATLAQSLPENDAFRKHVERIRMTRQEQEKHLRDMTDATHMQLAELLTTLQKAERWSECGAVARRHILQMAGINEHRVAPLPGLETMGSLPLR